MADERQEQREELVPAGASRPNGAENGNGHSHTDTGDGSGPQFHKQGAQKIEEAETAHEEKKEQEAKEAKKRPIYLNPIAWVVAVVLILALIFWGIPYYKYSTTHVGTDDAYVTGDLINISPIISGTLEQLTVDEGDVVQPGEVIARLDASGPRANYKQQLAAYQAAQSQIPQAQSTLAFEEASVASQISQAEAGIGAQNAKTAGAQEQVAASQGQLENQLKQAHSQVDQTAAAALQVHAEGLTALANLQSARQAVQTYQRAANAAEAQIGAAQANDTKTSRDEARYARLLSEDAVTQQQYDSALAAKQTADSQLAAVEEQAAQAQSALQQAKVEVQASYTQVKAAQEQENAALEQVDVARAGVGVAEANLGQVGVQQSNVLNNSALGQQSQAQLGAAKAGMVNVELRKQQVTTAVSESQQAKAALQNAKVTLDDTVISAPVGGTVVKKAVNIGDALTPGQTIVTMTRGQNVWVSANFKETQLTYVRPGQPAEVEVDAFPNTIFDGKVQSINEASGNATALLPADNATGNFTKVVQRIPVKIILYPAEDSDDKKYARQSQIDQLRQGMSTEATIDTSSAQK